MGISLKDIFKNDEERLLEDKRKNSIKLLIGLCCFLIVLIIVFVIIRYGANIDEVRRENITTDIQNVRTAVLGRAAAYVQDPSIGYPGYSLEAEGMTLNINGIEEEYRYGYYLLSSGDLVEISTALNLPRESYIVNYDTGDVINVTGVKFKGRRYHSYDDLVAIASGKPALSDNTYIIRKASDLEKMRQVPSGYFKLSANIDMSENLGYSTGEGWEPIPEFNGNFDGRGYTISNLKINRSTEKYVGLFGKVTSNANITNLKIENVNVVGSEYTGALAGDCKGYVSFVHINSGEVSGTDGSTGGLVGAYDINQISNCTVKVNVDGNADVGGAIGTLLGGTINRVSSEGYVTAANNVGGLIGQARISRTTYIHESISKSTVNGTNNLGGFIGSITLTSSKDLEVANSYARGAIQTGQSNIGGMFGQISTVQGTPKIEFKNLYTTVSGIVKGPSVTATGGFIGNCTVGSATSIMLSDCFWEKSLNPGEELDSIGQSTAGITIDVASKTSAEMLVLNTYTNWPFGSIWNNDFSSVVDDKIVKDTPKLLWEQNYIRNDEDEK